MREMAGQPAVFEMGAGFSPQNRDPDKAAAAR
jgi:hypothetical protein